MKTITCLALFISAFISSVSIAGSIESAKNPADSEIAGQKLVDYSFLPLPESKSGPLFIIPVSGQIEGALVYVFRRALKSAEEENARAIILDMDTPGGSLGAIFDIMDLLKRSKIPVYTYVNPNAISGGAMIAVSTDHIVMAPGSMIGDAKPIMGNPLPMGAPKGVPEDLKQKILSPTLAKIRAVCQQKGHNPNIVCAMIDEDCEVVLDGKTIKEKGKILTLTDIEAATMYGNPPKPLLSEGTFDSLNDLTTHLSVSQEDIQLFTISSSERLARVIAGPLSSILLGLGILFIYIEIKTPGFGIPGTIGIFLLAVWYWGQHIAALAGAWEMIVILIGISLILVEVFLIPGFGVTGFTGIILISTGIIAAMIPHIPWPQSSFEISLSMFSSALFNFTLSIMIFAVGIWLSAKFLPTLSKKCKLALNTKIDGLSNTPSIPSSLSVDMIGVAETPCRPSGRGVVNGERIDIIVDGSFVEKDSKIKLVERRGSAWIVKPVI